MFCKGGIAGFSAQEDASGPSTFIFRIGRVDRRRVQDAKRSRCCSPDEHLQRRNRLRATSPTRKMKVDGPLEPVQDLPAKLDNVGRSKPYASDISREKFEEILPVLQSARKRTKPTTVDLCEVFCAVLYLLRTGCQWRMLPRVFPKWRTVTPPTMLQNTL